MFYVTLNDERFFSANKMLLQYKYVFAWVKSIARLYLEH